MKHYTKIVQALLCVVVTMAFALPAMATEDHPQLKAFPEAEEGMVRHVISLPHKERGEEDVFRVELVAGKMMLTDGVNQIQHASTLEARPLQGWGYTYYEVIGKDLTISTKMAVPEGTEEVERLVTGKHLLINYNSRLPIVIYAPEGYEVRYRIWEAPPEYQAIENNVAE